MPERILNKVIDTVEDTVNGVEKEVDTLMKPVRKTVLQRFPILFLLAVTFGVVSVMFGFEKILTEIQFLNDRPLLILTMGIFVLIGTGTLYKKLG